METGDDRWIQLPVYVGGRCGVWTRRSAAKRRHDGQLFVLQGTGAVIHARATAAGLQLAVSQNAWTVGFAFFG